MSVITTVSDYFARVPAANSAQGSGAVDHALNVRSAGIYDFLLPPTDMFVHPDAAVAGPGMQAIPGVKIACGAPAYEPLPVDPQNMSVPAQTSISEGRLNALVFENAAQFWRNMLKPFARHW